MKTSLKSTFFVLITSFILLIKPEICSANIYRYSDNFGATHLTNVQPKEPTTARLIVTEKNELSTQKDKNHHDVDQPDASKQSSNNYLEKKEKIDDLKNNLRWQKVQIELRIALLESGLKERYKNEKVYSSHMACLNPSIRKQLSQLKNEVRLLKINLIQAAEAENLTIDNYSERIKSWRDKLDNVNEAVNNEEIMRADLIQFAEGNKELQKIKKENNIDRWVRSIIIFIMTVAGLLFWFGISCGKEKTKTEYEGTVINCEVLKYKRSYYIIPFLAVLFSIFLAFAFAYFTQIFWTIMDLLGL